MKKYLQRSISLTILSASLALCSLDYSEEVFAGNSPATHRRISNIENNPTNYSSNYNSATSSAPYTPLSYTSSSVTITPSSRSTSNYHNYHNHHHNNHNQQQQQQHHHQQQHHNHLYNHQQTQQPQNHDNTSTPQNIHLQTMKKLQKYLNYQQNQLIEANPGSLMAVAKAIKMTIVECQYQMRHEMWDCPIYGFGVKPVDIFGRLMSRQFKETSFINSLLSAAITHSIARACTESMISTCSRNPTRDGGFSENFEFGKEFAELFMLATRGITSSSSPALSSSSSSSLASNMLDPPPPAPPSSSSVNQLTSYESGSSLSPSNVAINSVLNHQQSNNIDVNMNNNLIGTGSGLGNNEPEPPVEYKSHPSAYTSSASQSHFTIERPTKRERREKIIRNKIDMHNDAVGRLARS